MSKDDLIFHTSSLLRKHKLLVEQDLDTGESQYVDWETYKPATKVRVAQFELECVKQAE